jgi:hypothetical protein
MSHSSALVPPRQPAQPANDCWPSPNCPLATRPPNRPATAAASRPTFRERIFDPAVIAGTFLSQLLDPDHPCCQAVSPMPASRVAMELSPCSGGTGASCKTRGRLPEEVLIQRTRTTGRTLEDRANRRWLCKGRRVKMVEGTDGRRAWRGERPDRFGPRAVKRRPKNYPRLQEPPAAALGEGQSVRGKSVRAYVSAIPLAP